MFNRSSSIIFLLIICVFSGSDLKAQTFPDHGDASGFRTDLRSLSLANNLPNVQARDDYVGISVMVKPVAASGGEFHLLNATRFSIYPNPGYNLWFQMSRWSNTAPSFSVATGLQYEFPGENFRLRKGVGLGWSETYGEIHVVRDVRVYGYLGYTTKRWDFGAAAALNMQHAIVDDGHAIPDYDETFYSLVPYIGTVIAQGHLLQLLIPADSKNMAFSIGYELQFGTRK